MQILLIIITLFSIACHSSPGTIRGPSIADSDTDSLDTDTDGPDTDTDDAGPCPKMVAIEDFCIDPYEAWLDGQSPFEVPQAGVATTGPGEIPQGYISGVVAQDACEAAGKRLCTLDEWMRACQGPQGWTYPYGNDYDANACNVSRSEHPVISLFGSNTDWSTGQMNDPLINQQVDTVDAGGANAGCVSAEGVYDLHGNLHEWISDPNGTFKGGFYADASLNGLGCTYATTAHSFAYHDYSTGFRCCSDPI
ncbi:MAG: SUMF1/EgtB/PvdO family nonheme iron enzyme [Proteobacteria bacterium]|jgi:formylglycine-generating enzyme|nr:SUMF1/EgtB/PvdO family nonheme iron enzyme [Pseudomonadota bacterium]